MKIIKSFLIVAAAMGVSTLVHAQEQQLKAEVAKPVASTVPPPDSKHLPAPDVKPESKNNQPLKQSEQTVIATPSPATRDEQIKAPVKPTIRLVDDKVSTTESLSAENLKTLNGTAERPKQTALANDQTPKLLPVTALAPAVIKIKENK